MGGLKNTAKRIGGALTGKGYMTSDERRKKKAAKVKQKKDKMFQDAKLPDAEEIKLVERRKAAKRKGARAQTVLTDRETLG
jgi:hypothetical protein